MNSKTFQKFLDNVQYTKTGILRYEKIFGRTYVGPGGEETTAKFTSELNLSEGKRVLDIGCGLGGSAFYMAKRYGALVHGVDLSENMIDIANAYRNSMPANTKHRVQFNVEDATTMDYPENFYDVIYSRDTILHIEDKEALFKLFFKALKPGGVVFISDYCHGDQTHSKKFSEYVAQRGYNLLTVKQYGAVLETAGFDGVDARDNTQYFVDILKKEMKEFEPKEAEMIKEYTKKDFDDIMLGWQEKVVRCGDGDQVWGYFCARKTFA